MRRVWAWVCAVVRAEPGFQTAEAIGIAAVGLLVLLAVLAAMETLGVDVMAWMRGQLGVPGS
ncbi:MAG: hypothetical protein ACE5GC_02065 [Acidimicrobiia bacterium]